VASAGAAQSPVFVSYQNYSFPKSVQIPVQSFLTAIVKIFSTAITFAKHRILHRPMHELTFSREAKEESWTKLNELLQRVRSAIIEEMAILQ